jgi:hypothetical protein
MALITGFDKDEGRRSRKHPTQVVCRYRQVITEDLTLVQLDTYGSEDRKSPGKVSQSLQLDEERALELIAILVRTFPRLASQA